MFFISQITYSFISFRYNILVQAFLQFICTVSLITPSHEVFLVFIHILFDKAVYEFGFASHSSILNHSINDMLAFGRIIIAIWVKVGNELKDISHINNVTVQKFKTEIYIFQALITAVWHRIFRNNRWCNWRIDKANCYVEVFTLIVVELLFC